MKGEKVPISREAQTQSVVYCLLQKKKSFPGSFFEGISQKTRLLGERSGI